MSVELRAISEIPGAGAVPDPRVPLSGRASFARALDEAQGKTPEERAREAAADFVSQTLVLPVLAQMREMNDAAEPFKPTQAEKQFGALLDARLAKDITRASGFPLVDRLARDLLRQQTGGVEVRA